MALDRTLPISTTPGAVTGNNYMDAVQEEVTGLWDRSVITLTAISGTDTILATATPALTASLVGGMNFILKPAATNTGAVTLNINSGGAVAVVDAENVALTAGALRINNHYLLNYDSGIAKFVVIGYTPATIVTVGSKLLATCAALSVPSNFDFFNGATPGVGSGGTGTVTASGTTVLDNTYDTYELVVSNLRPTTNDVELWLRIGTGGTPTYQTTLYEYSANFQTTTTTGNIAGAAQAKIVLGQETGATGAVSSTSTEGGVSCTIRFDNPETAVFTQFYFSGGYVADASSRIYGFQGVGQYASATAVTAVRIMFESGTIASGRVSLYGITKA